MIDALRNDDIVDKFGGRYKLTALIQRRWLQLLQGARPMVDPKGLTELEVVLREITDGKLDMDIPEGEPEEEAPPDDEGEVGEAEAEAGDDVDDVPADAELGWRARLFDGALKRFNRVMARQDTGGQKA